MVRRLKLAAAAFLAASLLAGCSMLSFDGSGGGPITVSTRDAGEAARLISAYRSSRGLGPLVVDAQLNEAASQQARAIARAGDLSHGDFASRMAAYDVAAASENLAMGSSTLTATIAQWKESRAHNANMLKDGMTRMGLARAETVGPRRNQYWALVLAR